MSKPLDVSGLRELFATGEMWGAIGVVRARGTDSHFDMRDGDVLVDVDLGSEGIPCWCRLGGCAGGAAMGLWRIPPVGTEVAVIVPRGDVRCDPMIVAVLSSGEVHADLDETTLLLVNTDKVKIKSTNDEVIIQDGTKGAARVDDPVKAATAMATWMGQVEGGINGLAPGTVTPLASTFSSNPGIGTILSGSSEVKIG